MFPVSLILDVAFNFLFMVFFNFPEHDHIYWVALPFFAELNGFLDNLSARGNLVEIQRLSG